MRKTKKASGLRGSGKRLRKPEAPVDIYRCNNSVALPIRIIHKA